MQLPRRAASAPRDRRCCGGGGSASRRGGGRLAWSGPGSRGGRAAAHGRAATAACRRRRLCSRRRPLPERSGARAARGSRRPRPAGQLGGRCRRTGRDPHGSAPSPGRGPGHLLHGEGTRNGSGTSGARRCPSGRGTPSPPQGLPRGHRAGCTPEGPALRESSERASPSPGRRRSRNLNLSLSSMCARKSICQIPSDRHNCSTGVFGCFFSFFTSFCSSSLEKSSKS